MEYVRYVRCEPQPPVPEHLREVPSGYNLRNAYWATCDGLPGRVVVLETDRVTLILALCALHANPVQVTGMTLRERRHSMEPGEAEQRDLRAAA